MGGKLIYLPPPKGLLLSPPHGAPGHAGSPASAPPPGPRLPPAPAPAPARGPLPLPLQTPPLLRGQDSVDFPSGQRGKEEGRAETGFQEGQEAGPKEPTSPQEAGSQEASQADPTPPQDCLPGGALHPWLRDLQAT